MTTETKAERKDNAWKEYRKIKIWKIFGRTCKECEKIRDDAWKAYNKILDVAFKEYEKIKKVAWEEYRKKCEEIDNEN